MYISSVNCRFAMKNGQCKYDSCSFSHQSEEEYTTWYPLNTEAFTHYHKFISENDEVLVEPGDFDVAFENDEYLTDPDFKKALHDYQEESEDCGDDSDDDYDSDDSSDYDSDY